MYVFAFIVFIVIPVSLVVFHLCTKRYLNPYKLTFVFGKKGSGKSTLLAKYATQYLRQGWNVFTTENIPGTYKLNASDVGVYQFPEHSCILIDEASLVWDNRDFKTMPKSTIEWYRLQRHHKCRVFLFSQTFDVDKKIRDLSDEMFLVTKKLRLWSYGKRILRQTVLVEATGQAPSKIDENLVFDTLLLFWAGSRTLTFIPHWVDLFDSFKLARLKDKEFEQVPLRDELIKDKRYRSRSRGRCGWSGGFKVSGYLQGLKTSLMAFVGRYRRRGDE